MRRCHHGDDPPTLPTACHVPVDETEVAVSAIRLGTPQPEIPHEGLLLARIPSYRISSFRPGHLARSRDYAAMPYPRHAKLSWRTCSWRNPPILLSHFLNMPLSWSS